MNRLLAAIVFSVSSAFLAAATAGCGPAHVEARAVVTPYPSLVYVSPGLWVLSDSALPIFYTDGLYWLYQDGYWYSSTYYTGGWIYAPLLRTPVAIRHVRRPRVYTHYRARAGQRTRRAPVVRDHRRRAPKSRPPRHATPRKQTRPRPRRRGGSP